MLMIAFCLFLLYFFLFFLFFFFFFFDAHFKQGLVKSGNLSQTGPNIKMPFEHQFVNLFDISPSLM